MQQVNLFCVAFVCVIKLEFSGSAIDASLKLLAERRTDIFGVGDEETAIGKKIGEEDVRKDEKVTWDGHTSSVEAATRAARANITLEEQIHQIHKVRILLLNNNCVSHALKSSVFYDYICLVTCCRSKVCCQMKKRKKLGPKMLSVVAIVKESIKSILML